MFALFVCSICGANLVDDLPPLWLDEWPVCCGLAVLLQEVLELVGP